MKTNEVYLRHTPDAIQLFPPFRPDAKLRRDPLLVLPSALPVMQRSALSSDEPAV